MLKFSFPSFARLFMPRANLSKTVGLISSEFSFRLGIGAFIALGFSCSSALAGNGDTTPPSVPTGLTASVVGCSSVSLSWGVSTDPNGPQAGMAGYKIYRNSVCIFTNGLTTSFSDTTISGNNSATYQVSAIDKTGNESALTGGVLVSPCPDVTVPSAPASLTASVVDSSTVSLSWAAASDRAGKNYEVQSGVKGYQIYRNGTDAGSKIADLAGGGAVSFTDLGAAPNSAVYYAIRTIDNNNNVSSFTFSPTVTTPQVPPGAPTGLFVNVSDCKKASLSWTPPVVQGAGIAWYNVYRDGQYLAQAFYPSIEDNSVVPSRIYSYSVTTVDNLNRESSQSQSFSVLSSVCPAVAAQNVRIHIAGDQAVLSWEGTPGALYQVECAAGFGGAWVPVDVPTRNMALTNIAIQPTAIYRVALLTNTADYLANYAVNQSDTAAPTSPQTLNIDVVSDTEAGLSWNPVADNGTMDPSGQVATSGLDRYVIYRDGVFLKSAPPYITQVTDTSAIAESTYTYSVAAVDKSGNLSSTASSSVLMRKPCTYTLGTTSGSFGSGAGSSSFAVTAGSTCPWSAVASDASWIHTGSSGTGSGTVAFSVDSNGSSISRNGTITVGGKVFSISQAGLACSYSIFPNGMSHDANTQGGSFNIYAVNGCSWTATSAYSWIHTGSSGNGNGSVNYTVDANTGTTTRSGTIVVAGQTFNISQSGVSCSYVLSPTSLSHGSGAASGSFNVTAPSGCSWSASTTYAWVHTSSSGSGNGTINYTIDSNTGASSRSGTISVGGQTFTVTQSGVSCSYSLNSGSANVGSSAGSGSFNIFTSAGCSWSATTVAGWIHTTSAGSGNGTINYTVDANTTISPRSGTIVVAGQNFSITQAGLTCTYVVSPLSLSHGSGADNGSFLVTSLVGCGWSASTGAGWIHTSSSGNGTGTVSYSIDANTSTSARSDVIFVAGQSFTVYQAAATACSYSVSQTSSSYSASGGSGSIGVTANAGCAWSSSSDSGWLTITSGNSGSGNGNVGYSVAANTSTSSRSGNLTIGGQLVNITQSGASSGPDTTAPTVNITAPASGVTLSGTATVTANVSDNVSVTTVQFYVDNLGSWILVGTQVGSGASANYSQSIDTTILASGAHNLLVRGYDAAGNSSYSLLGVTVSNFNPDPGILAWAKDMGQSPVGSEALNSSVKVDSQGNQVVVGKFSGTVNFSGTTLTSQGGYDFYVAKFNANGTLAWIHSYGGVYDNVATSVAVDGADNIAVSGYFVGSMNLGGTTLVSGGGNTTPDMFVAKFSSTGAHIWSKRFGGPYGNYANAVAVDKNNDIFVTGQYNLQADFGGGVVQSAGGGDGFLVKYAGASGAYMWARSFGGANYDDAETLAIDANGDVLVSGFSTGSMDFGGGIRPNAGGSDAFLVKYVGSTGAHVWSRMIGGAGNEGAEGVSVDSVGNGVLVGSFTQTLTIDGVTLTAPLSTAMVIARFSPTGNLIWAKAIGGQSSVAGSVGPQAAAVDGAGNIIITGTATGEADFGNGQTTAGTGNIFIAKYTASGGYLWSKRFASTGWSSGAAIAIDQSRNIFGAGSFGGTVNFDTIQLSTVNTQIRDPYLLKISP